MQTKKYFIGYALEDVAADWHRTLAQDISHRFKTWRVDLHVPAHITLVRPFELKNEAEILSFLEAWSKQRSSPGDMHVDGFGRFDDRVIFAHIDAPDTVYTFVHALQNDVQTIVPVENPYTAWRPHATLAYHLSPPEIESIWEYVQTLDKPIFPLPVQNITLFRQTSERHWVVEQTYGLKN